MFRHAGISLLTSLIVLCLAATGSHAQTMMPFYVYGEMFDLDSRTLLMNGVIRAVDVDDPAVVIETRIDSKGRYELQLPFDKAFKVEFISPGYIGRHLLFDLRGLEVKRRNGDHGMNIEASLIRPLEGVDYSIFVEKPYGICQLNARGRAFEWDTEYTTTIMPEFQVVLDTHQAASGGVEE